MISEKMMFYFSMETNFRLTRHDTFSSTLFSGGSKAELGASWIHGVLGNPLYELAVSKGLVDIVQTPKPHNVAAVTEDGRRLPFNVLQVS